MKKYLWFVLVALIVCLVAFFAYMRLAPSVQRPSDDQPATSTPTLPEEKPGIKDLIEITRPASATLVESPLLIKGRARGTWFFEASFPIKLVDGNGNLLGSTIATAETDWMTTEFVPFTANLTFTLPSTTTGMLIFEKDNPSGLPEHAAEFRMPVRLEVQETAVKLFYYKPQADQDASGNILCSRQGLVSVSRTIPKTATPIQDVIRELLKGQLTPEEKQQGITTEFPLSGVTLKGATLKEGILTLEFTDPNNRTSGGSCRAGILWHQIEATAKQFEGVQTVVFKPESLFQP